MSKLSLTRRIVAVFEARGPTEMEKQLRYRPTEIAANNLRLAKDLVRVGRLNKMTDDQILARTGEIAQVELVADFKARIAAMMRQQETGKQFSVGGGPRANPILVRDKQDRGYDPQTQESK